MKFDIGFYGYCTIEAETKEEAKRKFYNLVTNDDTLPSSYYDIELIEESREED